MSSTRLFYLICVTFPLICASVQNQTIETSTSTQTTTLLRDDYYLRTNVKFPVDKPEPFTHWFYTKQLIFLVGGVSACCVLLLGLSVQKYCKVRNEANEGRQLLVEEDSQEDDAALEPSDDEEFTVPPVLIIN